MKKLFAVTLTLMMLLGCMSITAFAEDADLSAKVSVTLSDKGNLVVTQEIVTVTDVDQDGTLTLSDALYAAHEAKYAGGASAGYATAVTDWGLGITKLWGDTSGNYGYYVNNASAYSLADPVKEGDTVNAFVYADGTTYSDTYCWFDERAVIAEAGSTITLTLLGAGYDVDWNPVTLPVAGATVTVNGEKIEVKTDAEGKATLTLSEAGSYLISAVSDTQTLVPPVCKATVTAAQTPSVPAEPNQDATSSEVSSDSSSPNTGVQTDIRLYVVLLPLLLGGMAVLALRKNRNEK